jgi:hypothetical protein
VRDPPNLTLKLERPSGGTVELHPTVQAPLTENIEHRRQLEGAGIPFEPLAKADGVFKKLIDGRSCRLRRLLEDEESLPQTRRRLGEKDDISNAMPAPENASHLLLPKKLQARVRRHGSGGRSRIEPQRRRRRISEPLLQGLIVSDAEIG